MATQMREQRDNQGQEFIGDRLQEEQRNDQAYIGSSFQEKQRETREYTGKPQEEQLDNEELIAKKLQEEEQVDSLDREIKQNNKKIKQIETSNTWKLSNVFRRMREFIHTIFNRQHRVEQDNRIEELERQVKEREIEVQYLRENMYSLQLQDNEFTRSDIEKQIRQLKNEGELIQLLDRLIDQKLQGQENFREALTYAARLYMNKDSKSRDYIYKKVLHSLSVEEMPEFMMRMGLEEDKVPLQQVSSYRASLHQRLRQLQLCESLPEWELDDKRTAYQFMQTMQVPVPFVDEQTYSIHDIPVRDGTVIKPKDGAGGRGVYVIHGMDDIIDVKKSAAITSEDALKESMQQDLTTEAVSSDEWMLEELIYEDAVERTPARDVKFYCFYGKVGVILEIIRYPEIRHCWWTADGERIPVGKYDESLFSGMGVTDEELDMAASISSEIPAPFIRIDFLRGEDGLVFGEFTPKPGNYDEFDKDMDQQLGDLFIEAEGKLTTDLLQGKTFNTYQEFVRNRESIT